MNMMNRYKQILQLIDQHQMKYNLKKLLEFLNNSIESSINNSLNTVKSDLLELIYEEYLGLFGFTQVVFITDKGYEIL